MSSATLTEPGLRIRNAVMHERPDAANAGYLQVNIVGSVATLRGPVSSWAQRAAVERAIADAPGVTRVDNQLEIRPNEIPEA